MSQNYLTKESPYFNRIIIFLCIMSALTQAGLVLYTPAFIQISTALHISHALMKMTLTSYLLGFGGSQLFYGPLSDRMGRKKVLVTSMLIFSLGCLWSIFSHDYISFTISRVIQGIGAGSCMSLSRAILRDCFNGKNYIHAASYLSAGFAVGLGITPVIGGHLLTYFPWQSEFVFLFICGVIMLLAFAFLLPETYIPELPLTSTHIFWQQTFKDCFGMLQNRHFMSCLVGGVVAYGVVIAYTTMGPFLFQQSLQFSSVSYGWLTLLVAAAYYASTETNRRFIHILSPLQTMKIGIYFIIIAGFFMLIPILFFHSRNSYYIIIPLLLATYGQAFVWSNTIALALEGFSKIAGTASSFFSFLQMIFVSIISVILALPHETNQFPLAVTIILLGLISMLIFYFSGIFKMAIKKP